jgi:hypothetical protein
MKQNWNFIGFFLLSIIFLHSCGSSNSNDEKVDLDISTKEPSSTCSSGENLFPVSGSGSFNITEDTISFMIHALSDVNQVPSFNSFSSPDGSDIKSMLSQNRSDIPWRGEKYSNVMIPISSIYQATSGFWNYSTSSTTTLCLTTRKGTISNNPTIKIQPYITGSTYTSNDISSALTIMKTIYSTNGVTLNVLGTSTLSESKYARVSKDFTNSVTSEMVSKGLADRVNLFFISDYTDASYLGNSSGIPGSQGLKGSHNGVLISISAHEKQDGSGLNDQLLGETAAHEMGHFLGLWHPTEGYQYKKYGLDYDPITDTPQCPSSKNTNNDSKLTAEECGQEYGADNLMFWSPWTNSLNVRLGNQDNLTEGQVYVLKRALIAK